VSISHSWSRRLAGLLLLELLVLAIPGCGSMLAFTPERAAIEALLGPAERTGRSELITPGSVKVAQTQEWQDGSLVAVTFSAFEDGTGPVDCLYIFEVIRDRYRWAARSRESTCEPAGGGESFQQLQSQMWGTDISGMTTAYGLVFDSRIAALDILWEDGEREAVEVINGTYLRVREGVHEIVLERPLDANGDLVE
jgi:hypothetical protein